MSYSEAMRVWQEHSAPDDGFYLSKDEKNGRRGVLLAVQLQGKRNRHQQLFNVYKPNSGLQARPEQLKTIKNKHKKVRHFVHKALLSKPASQYRVSTKSFTTL